MGRKVADDSYCLIKLLVKAVNGKFVNYKNSKISIQLLCGIRFLNPSTKLLNRHQGSSLAYL